MKLKGTETKIFKELVDMINCRRTKPVYILVVVWISIFNYSNDGMATGGAEMSCDSWRITAQEFHLNPK